MLKKGFLYIAIFILACSYLYYQLTNSPIKDPLLRGDVLIELNLEEHLADRKRPNKEDLKSLTTLTHRYDPTRYDSVESIKGLEYAENLEELILNFNEIISIKPLGNLTKLHTLNLSYTDHDEGSLFGLPERRIKDISPLENLVHLKKLSLSNNSIQDFSVLNNFTELEELSITENGLDELPEEISTLQHLRVLYAAENRIEHVESLHGLTNLEKINVSDNPIADFTPLKAAENLKELKMTTPYSRNELKADYLAFLSNHPRLTTLHARIYENTHTDPIEKLVHLKDIDFKLHKVLDLAFLSPLIELEYVELDSVSIFEDEKLTSIEPLKNAIQMKELKVSGNKIKSIEPLRNMRELVELEIYVNSVESFAPLKDAIHLKKLFISSNPAGSLEGLSELVNLEELIATNLDLQSIEQLEKLTNLRLLLLDDNNIEDLEPLKGLQNLEYLSLENNSVKNVDTLKELTSLQGLNIVDNPIDKKKGALEELKVALRQPNRIDVLDD